MSSSRSKSLWVIALLLLLFGGGALLTAVWFLDGTGPALGAGRVAILPVEGVIDSEERTLRQLSRYRENGSVRAFVLEIRSPGGAVAPSQALYREIRRLREEDDRPVIAWMGDVAASGGYYVALAADSIYALPGTLTGSIGVIMQFPNAEELFDKVGVEWAVVKSGEHKDIGSPLRDLSEADRAVLEGIVEDVWGQFVDAVAENRPLPRDSVRALADGRVFTGEQAVELGLADGIGTLDEAVELAGRLAGLGERPATLRPEEPRFGLLDLLLGVSPAEIRRLFGDLPAALGTPRLRHEWR